VGITDPQSKLHIVSEQQGLIIEGSSTLNDLSLLSLESKNKDDKSIGVKSQEDDNYNFLVNGNGSIQIGNGSSYSCLSYNEKYSLLEIVSKLLFQQQYSPILLDKKGIQHTLIVNTKVLLDTI